MRNPLLPQIFGRSGRGRGMLVCPPTPVIIGIECPAAFLPSRGLFHFLCSSRAQLRSGKSECTAGRTKRVCVCRARVHRSFVPSLSCSSRSRGQEFFRLSRFFQEKRSIFPSFSLFPFFRWFFWQQAINPIIGLGEPLFVPVDDPPLSILSLSGV